MRKIVAGLFISLDGVTEAPNIWQENFDEEMGAELAASTDAADAILLGRVTYEDWAGYWPTSTDEPFATFINTTPKYVISTTLDKVAWGSYNSISLIKNNLVAEINRLKQQPGKNINVAGSTALVESLIQLDLLDELMLMIHPVIAGKGKRLFQDDSPLKRLKLVDSKTSRTGTLIVTYQPLKNA